MCNYIIVSVYVSSPNKGHLSIKDKLCDPYRTMTIQFYLQPLYNNNKISKGSDMISNFIDGLSGFQIMKSFTNSCKFLSTLINIVAR